MRLVITLEIKGDADEALRVANLLLDDGQIQNSLWEFHDATADDSEGFEIVQASAEILPDVDAGP